VNINTETFCNRVVLKVSEVSVLKRSKTRHAKLPVITALGSGRRKTGSLGCMVRSCLKKKKKNSGQKAWLKPERHLLTA
jgi:hypothetical protein